MYGFRDIETAAYCARKLYYRRRSPPPDVPENIEEKRELAFEYERLLADDSRLRNAPIEVTPTQYRSRLGCLKARLDHWDQLIDPASTHVFLSGKDCHGIAHKLLDCSPPSLSLVFTGSPPDTGVWKPQSVRLVAAAKALAWEREQSVSRVFAEYPTHGVIRPVELTVRRTAAYREALRTAKSIDGPPARVNNREKCKTCEFQSECGVRTRSLRSLIGRLGGD